jgi:single-strand DNA-binding protein
MSSSNINNVVLTGRLTSDPDLRALPSGASVCHLRVAVNVRRRNAAGEWNEKPNFFDVVVFGASGENVAKYMRKGRAVAVDGRLDWREWETKDGRSAQAVSIVARTVQFLDGPRADRDGRPPDQGEEDGGLGLQSIAGDEEEDLDFEDQEAIAAAAA